MGTPGDYGMSSDTIAEKRRMYSVDSATTSGLLVLVHTQVQHSTHQSDQRDAVKQIKELHAQASPFQKSVFESNLLLEKRSNAFDDGMRSRLKITTAMKDFSLTSKPQ